MPYTHLHDWSLHRHRQRRKGGRHWRDIRRRQKPWRIAALMLGIGLLGAVVVMLVMRNSTLSGWATAIPAVMETTRAVDERGRPMPEPTRNPEVAQTMTAEVKATARVYQTRTAEDRHARVEQLERRVHELINVRRVEHGSLPLKWDDGLASVARAHSADMADRQFFDHANPEGLNPTDRLHKAGQSCRNGAYYGIGENIVIESNLNGVRITASEAVWTWMNSHGHRKNLLRKRYRTTGIGVAYGPWKGYKAAYLTQVFC